MDHEDAVSRMFEQEPEPLHESDPDVIDEICATFKHMGLRRMLCQILKTGNSMSPGLNCMLMIRMTTGMHSRRLDRVQGE
jgi:hypothetical protein